MEGKREGEWKVWGLLDMKREREERLLLEVLIIRLVFGTV